MCSQRIDASHLGAPWALLLHPEPRLHLLILALSVLAESDEAERARLAAAAGAANTKETLAASLHALARLAGDWLERDDHAARALVAAIDLTTADIEAALAAAHAVISGNGVPEARSSRRRSARRRERSASPGSRWARRGSAWRAPGGGETASLGVLSGKRWQEKSRPGQQPSGWALFVESTFLSTEKARDFMRI